MAIKQFEDIESWKAARKLTKEVYQLANQRKFTKDFGLRIKSNAPQFQSWQIPTLLNSLRFNVLHVRIVEHEGWGFLCRFYQGPQAKI